MDPIHQATPSPSLDQLSSTKLPGGSRLKEWSLMLGRLLVMAAVFVICSCDCSRAHWFTKLDFSATLTLLCHCFPPWGEKTDFCSRFHRGLGSPCLHGKHFPD